MTKIIKNDNIARLLGQLAEDAEVWAPRELAGTGTAIFERWQDGVAVDLEHITSISAKDVVLPRTEKLFDFNYAFGDPIPGENIEIVAAVTAPATVLFGARACDAKALTVLDALFDNPESESYNDPNYQARRRALTVITLACTTADAACFCSSFGEGPAGKAGSDLILYPLEGGYLAEAVTARGESILDAATRFFEESNAEPPQLAETATVEGLDGLQQQLPAIFKDLDFWNEITATCISCGFCSHGCPTCYCFNIHDEMSGDRKGERLRSWDACMFYVYTQEASGHNPRPTQAHRYRNRINHKFSYYPVNQGETLCTGCGRCIRGCPTNLDIREVLRAAKARAVETELMADGGKAETDK
ncbi:MAG: 4Fe-4S dicluster domain-containing protein [Actinobacteria bacterium]|nr:4Fe-4S dicluster domain-containing protein [Actinomycetota bacterium]